MRSFNCNLDLFKSTEQKLRWDEDVDGTKFEFYIPKWRVPEPTPQMISVKIYDASSFDPLHQLDPVQKFNLSKLGFKDDEIREIDKWLPLQCVLEPHSTWDITSVVEFAELHTKTARYRPILEPKYWEIGEPYVPISVLPSDLPRKLILRIRWM
jgi:hypothetical protein